MPITYRSFNCGIYTSGEESQEIDNLGGIRGELRLIEPGYIVFISEYGNFCQIDETSINLYKKINWAMIKLNWKIKKILEGKELADAFTVITKLLGKRYILYMKNIILPFKDNQYGYYEMSVNIYTFITKLYFE